jgi:hypothetical protein
MVLVFKSLLLYTQGRHDMTCTAARAMFIKPGQARVSHKCWTLRCLRYTGTKRTQRCYRLSNVKVDWDYFRPMG